MSYGPREHDYMQMQSATRVLTKITTELSIRDSQEESV